MKNYCWTCDEETDHEDVRDDYGTCQICGRSNWTSDYPIAPGEVPQNPLLAARQRYQKDKAAYYQRIEQKGQTK